MNAKKQLITWICFLVAAALLVTGLTVFFILQPVTLYAVPTATESTNQNNYLRPNVLDATDGKIGYLTRNWFGHKLVLINAEGGLVDYPQIDGAFRLLEDGILYTDGGKLLLLNAQNETEELATNVTQFAHYGESIAYLQADGVLSLYSTSSKEHEKVTEEILQFYIHEDKLYAIQKDGSVVSFFKKGNLQSFLTLSLLQLEIADPDSFLAMPCGKNIVYLNGTGVVFVNTDTQEVHEVTLSATPISLICNDETVYVSVKSNNSEENGIWQIEAETQKMEKICDKPFYDLYLYTGDRLIAAEDGAYYQIDPEGKTYQRICN